MSAALYRRAGKTDADPRAKAYMEKRMGEGKSWREALRCVKRHLANVVLRTMLADASTGVMTWA